VIARPQLRRGRICQLRALDHQRPRVRLERLKKPRLRLRQRMRRDDLTPREIEVLVFFGCMVGIVGVLVIGAIMKACS
jgi:hypothetical protein